MKWNLPLSAGRPTLRSKAVGVTGTIFSVKKLANYLYYGKT